MSDLEKKEQEKDQQKSNQEEMEEEPTNLISLLHKISREDSEKEDSKRIYPRKEMLGECFSFFGAGKYMYNENKRCRSCNLLTSILCL